MVQTNLEQLHSKNLSYYRTIHHMITVNVYLGPIKIRTFAIDDSDIEVIHNYLPRSLLMQKGFLRFETIFSIPHTQPKQFDPIKPKMDDRKVKLLLAYKALGLKMPCEPTAIKARYRKLVKMYHPDNRETGNTSKYQNVVASYNTITGVL